MATLEAYLDNQRDIDGVQFTWNLPPHSRVDLQKLVVPFASFFTPLKEKPAEAPQQPPLEYDPILCQKPSCKSVLNPFSFVDFRAKIWTCSFCNQRNPFPPHYAGISEENRPPELYPQFSTIEYTLRKATTLPPIFLFVADTCVTNDEMAALKASLKNAVSLLPADAFVGLITYGRNIEVHELNSTKDMYRSYVFKGTKDVTQEQIRKILNLTIGRPSGPGGSAAPTPGVQQPPFAFQQPGAAPGIRGPAPGVLPGQQGIPPMSGQPGQAQQHPAIPSNKFLQPVSDCESSLLERIDSLQTDRWPEVKSTRSLRATGTAMAVAVTLLEVCYPNTGARIMTLIGGPCTTGPGMVINEEKKNPIRSSSGLPGDS